MFHLKQMLLFDLLLSMICINALCNLCGPSYFKGPLHVPIFLSLQYYTTFSLAKMERSLTSIKLFAANANTEAAANFETWNCRQDFAVHIWHFFRFKFPLSANTFLPVDYDSVIIPWWGLIKGQKPKHIYHQRKAEEREGEIKWAVK